jgi:hypothetical protein
MTRSLPLPLVLLLATLGGCATIPTGPSVLVLPGRGVGLERFQSDDVACRRYALAQIGGASAQQAANESLAKSAAVGTAVGAAAGAALGGHEGAGTGAGVGLVAGSVAGASAANASGAGSQRRYDNAYVQCMYAKGNKVPVYGSFIAPPPPGTPPPPPPPTAGK